ncbi:MAG: prolipoprotein diacylglyceryl transferase, partial [[Eubacterium] siraeum]|nr:prolipoprotein diacylglyceryl transferase [[Eubacterium] siraeum]
NKYTLITVFSRIHDGGLAIYGGVIVGVITGIIVSKIKKTPFLPLLDVTGPAFLIGQAIGRWGNFINQECYGAPTAGNLPWGMTGTSIALDPVVIAAQAESEAPVLVHPCFLYESLWCIIGFLLIHFAASRFKSFDGELFLYYVMWYGAGRGWIEGLRTDSLYAGSVKISQLVAIASAVIAVIMIIYFKLYYKKHGRRIYAETDLSRERLEGYQYKLELEKEKEAARKAFKAAEKAKTETAPSIFGEDTEGDTGAKG